MNMHIRMVVGATLWATAGVAAGAQAPSAPSAPSAPARMRAVTLIEADNDRTPAPAMVLRLASGTERDLIALTDQATARDLADALRVLEVLHAKYGDTLTRDIAVSGRLIETGEALSTRDTLHASYIRALRSSPVRQVAGVGSVRAHRILVPRRALVRRQ